MTERNSITTVLADFDDLTKTIAREQYNRPVDLKEEPIVAYATYIISPLLLPRKYVEIGEFVQVMRSNFSLKFDDSEIRSILQAQNGDISPEQIFGILIERDSTLKFHHGMLRFAHPERITPINSLQMSNEAVAVSVVGSTTEAAWIAQKSLELLWRVSGAERSWRELSEHIQLVGYKTKSKAYLGLNLIDLFSENFKRFVDTKIRQKNSFGSEMGRHPVNPEFLGNESGCLTCVSHVHQIDMRVSIFNELTGRSEDCDFQLSVDPIHEIGQGWIYITSELDSTKHTQLIINLREIFLSAS